MGLETTLGATCTGADKKVKAYTIHEPPEPPADRMDRAESLIFVKEGMSWTALLFAPLWMLYRGLWLAFAGYVVLLACWLAGGLAIGSGDDILAWGVAVLHIVIGLEADSIERWSLRRARWRELGSVTGQTRDECERNFFEGWLHHQPVFTARHENEPGLGAHLS